MNTMKYEYEFASRYHEKHIQGGMSFPLLEMTNPFRYCCVAPVYIVFIFALIHEAWINFNRTQSFFVWSDNDAQLIDFIVDVATFMHTTSQHKYKEESYCNFISWWEMINNNHLLLMENLTNLAKRG